LSERKERRVRVETIARAIRERFSIAEPAEVSEDTRTIRCCCDRIAEAQPVVIEIKVISAAALELSLLLSFLIPRCGQVCAKDVSHPRCENWLMTLSDR